MAGQRSLHQLLDDAVQRAAEVQEDSYDVAKRHRAVTAALDDTLRSVRANRQRRATFGNGQRGAGRRSRPG